MNTRKSIDERITVKDVFSRKGTSIIECSTNYGKVKDLIATVKNGSIINIEPLNKDEKNKINYEYIRLHLNFIRILKTDIII